jgi:hypothetical protein
MSPLPCKNTERASSPTVQTLSRKATRSNFAETDSMEARMTAGLSQGDPVGVAAGHQAGAGGDLADARAHESSLPSVLRLREAGSLVS